MSDSTSTPGTSTPTTESAAPENAAQGTTHSAVDIDRDGNADVVHGTTAEGTPINTYLDDNGNVVLVEADTDDNGTFDTLVYGGPDGTTIVESDSDDDGSADVVAQLSETGDVMQINHIEDGQVVSSAIDVDGDGNLDVQFVDTDRDGGYETTVMDADNDGSPDTVVTDTDGDGQADSVSYTGGDDTTLDAPDAF
ncbi:hypothetical protein V1Y59_12775 [Gordonia sp. PKS22-38]|uniref:Uncharacterized protein n=1 Tax=Gordonia prachuapensis TaxID=3115651 RepID=A0ABU7MUE9_9ACTN|nr:hypothetical protein [Gordonia sp. PKS22-38]